MNSERLDLLGKSIEEDKQFQIEKIKEKLETLEYEHILDIADNIWWGAKKIYNPSKECIISKDKFERIMKEYPELLI